MLQTICRLPASVRSKTFCNKIRKHKIIAGQSKNYRNFSAISAVYSNIGLCFISITHVNHQQSTQRAQFYLHSLLGVETRLQCPQELNSKGHDCCTMISEQTEISRNTEYNLSQTIYNRSIRSFEFCLLTSIYLTLTTQVHQLSGL